MDGWGLQGPLAHRDLWQRLWCSLQLLGDSVLVQWVPLHVGVQGNEGADQCAQQGASKSLHQVRVKCRTFGRTWVWRKCLNVRSPKLRGICTVTECRQVASETTVPGYACNRLLTRFLGRGQS